MDSVWTNSVELPHFSPLEENMKTDVLVIGGGITGILCAYFLQEKGVDCVLAEGNTIGSGITGNTTAKITAQHGLIYHKLLKNAGAGKACMYYNANQDAVKKYAALSREFPCDFEWRPSYVYDTDDRRVLEQEADALEQIGSSAKLVDKTGLPFPVAGAIRFENQAQFHPLKFLAGISRSLKIYEHTYVKELIKNTAVTDRGKIGFQKAVFATHFPFDNQHGMYFLKLYQHRSYVIALKNAAELDGMYVDRKKTGLSFRNYQDLLLIGGGAHRTGEKGGNWKELRDFAVRYYPKAQETAYWAAQDCMSLDEVPYIGPYAKSMPDCLVATGFNKWGMTSAMAAAMILTDLILQKDNPYKEAFAPARSILKPQLFRNGCETVKNLLTFTSKRCPHLGCALKWNSLEHSWDCPCHGSRFDIDGHLLDNPATGDLKQ